MQIWQLIIAAAVLVAAHSTSGATTKGDLLRFRPITQSEYEAIMDITDGRPVISEGRLSNSGLAGMAAGLATGWATSLIPSFLASFSGLRTNAQNSSGQYPLCVIRTADEVNHHRGGNQQQHNDHRPPHNQHNNHHNGYDHDHDHDHSSEHHNYDWNSDGSTNSLAPIVNCIVVVQDNENDDADNDDDNVGDNGDDNGDYNDVDNGDDNDDYNGGGNGGDNDDDNSGGNDDDNSGGNGDDNGDDNDDSNGGDNGDDNDGGNGGDNGDDNDENSNENNDANNNENSGENGNDGNDVEDGNGDDRSSRLQTRNPASSRRRPQPKRSSQISHRSGGRLPHISPGNRQAGGDNYFSPMYWYHPYLQYPYGSYPGVYPASYPVGYPAAATAPKPRPDLNSPQAKAEVNQRDEGNAVRVRSRPISSRAKRIHVSNGHHPKEQRPEISSHPYAKISNYANSAYQPSLYPQFSYQSTYPKVSYTQALPYPAPVYVRSTSERPRTARPKQQHAPEFDSEELDNSAEYIKVRTNDHN